MRNKYSPIFNLNLYLIHSAICRRCREHIGKAIASREDSEKPSDLSASRLVNQQYPPSEVFVEPPTEVVELPRKPQNCHWYGTSMLVYVYGRFVNHSSYLHTVFNRLMHFFNRKKRKVVSRI